MSFEELLDQRLKALQNQIKGSSSENTIRLEAAIKEIHWVKEAYRVSKRTQATLPGQA